MQKIITLKPDDDITSVVEYIWETGADEIYLVAPKNSAILKNVISLKLLKREADRLEKDVVLIVKDAVGREIAKRVGLAARATMPKAGSKKEEEPEEEPEEELDDQENILRELPPQKFESMIQEQIKIKKQAAVSPAGMHSIRMSDIRLKEEPVLERKIEVEIKEEPAEPVQQIAVTTGEEIEQFIQERPAQRIIEEADHRPDTIGQFMAQIPISPDQIAQETQRASKFRSFRSEKFLEPELEEEEKRSGLSSKLFMGFIGGALLIALAVLYFVLPKADVSVVAKSVSVEQDLSITADKNLSKADSNAGRIPAQMIKLDKKESAEFDATGERQFNDKAKGTITVYNEFSSSAQALVEKTRFVSDDGKIFRTTKSVTIPGAKIVDGNIEASSINVEVIADEAGDSYNIGPSNFKIPGFQGTAKYDKFYGVSKEAMSGGVIGSSKVVTAEDIQRAKDQVWQTLRNSLDQEFKSQVPEGLKFLDNAKKQEISETSTTAEAGAKAEKFTMTVRGTVTALLLDENDIYELAAKKISGAGTDKDIKKEESSITYKDIIFDFTKGTIKFKAHVTAKLVSKMEPEKIREEIAGKSESEVKDIMAGHPEIDRAQIVFWPFWVKSVPSSLDKIKINTQ